MEENPGACWPKTAKFASFLRSIVHFESVGKQSSINVSPNKPRPPPQSGRPPQFACAPPLVPTICFGLWRSWLPPSCCCFSFLLLLYHFILPYASTPCQGLRGSHAPASASGSGRPLDGATAGERVHDPTIDAHPGILGHLAGRSFPIHSPG